MRGDQHPDPCSISLRNAESKDKLFRTCFCREKFPPRHFTGRVTDRALSTSVRRQGRGVGETLHVTTGTTPVTQTPQRRVRVICHGMCVSNSDRYQGILYGKGVLESKENTTDVTPADPLLSIKVSRTRHRYATSHANTSVLTQVCTHTCARGNVSYKLPES